MGLHNIDETEPESRGPYRYQSLLPSPTSIRLLKIIGKDKDEKPHVSLEAVDLEDNPFYYALSYTWGNPYAHGVDFTEYFNAVTEQYGWSRRIPILCDGKVIHVQKNLLDALYELEGAHISRQEPERGQESSSESPSGSQSDLCIWIDAICINQNDFEERAVQVKLMDEIYRKAANTIVWLGCEDQWSTDAAKVISRIAAYPRDSFVKSEVKPFRRQDSEIYERYNLAYTSWTDWCSLAALLKRQWFSRLWIIQETILSRHLVLLCGKQQIVWAELVSAVRNIEARCDKLGWSPSIMFIEAGQPAVPLEHNALKLANWREHHHNKEASGAWRFTLEDLIYDTWVFVATNPRDKIYGVFGLMDPEMRATWPVEYQSSIEKVYAVATRRIIKTSQSLKILSCVQDASMRRIGAYPSWVPDFSLPYFNMMCNAGFYSATGKHIDNTTTQTLLSPAGSWSRLRLRASVVDTIVETGNDRTSHINSAIILDPSWFELTLLLKTPYPGTGQRRTEVLWRTLCADQDASSTINPAPARFAELFKELVSAMVVVRAEIEEEASQEPDPAPDCAMCFVQAMKKAKEMWVRVGWDRLSPAEIHEQTNSRPRLLWRPEYGWLAYTLVKLQALAVTEQGQNADTPNWEELETFYGNPSYVMRVVTGKEKSLVQPNDASFFNSFRKRYGKRKLFVTEKGYLGLGPASTAVGDMVCILPGAAGPFVFRKDEGGGIGLDDDNVDVECGEIRKLRLVGESYIHGIMHGEAVEAGGAVMEEIEIV
ncbi:Heterokaryon incompatibility domain-containing protein [Madurella fahalii]|uniref:Heterokaryon incompatibility domain-containing protein n=1 Tax=Madurella fahalii TaxID=1157608 RepID=A0ABQ0GKM9_9PEZI